MIEQIFPFVLAALSLAIVGRIVWRMLVQKELKTSRERWLFVAFLVVGLLGFFFDPFPKVR